MDFTNFKSPLNISPQSEAKRLSKELENLKLKSNGELQELLERHSNILNKPHLVAGLPDKGEKLQRLKARIEAELTARASPACVDNVINAMSSVQLSDTLEWNVAESVPAPISADTSQDPLYNFLQNTETNKDNNYDPYVQSLCKKYGSPQDGEMQMNQRFMPFRSTENSPKSIAEKKGSNTSPHAHLTKQLPLTESLELQKTQAQTVAQKSSASLMNVWRQRATIGSDTEDEEEEEAEQLEVEKDEEEEGDAPQVPDNE